MVIVTKYGIELERLQKKDIEQVRIWRNDPEIVRYMAYKKYISSKEQEKWFLSLRDDQDYFFIVKWQNEKIGLVNLKDLDIGKNKAEAGIFFGDKAVLNTIVPYAVSFSLLDYGFETLGLKQIVAHILRDNKRAIRYNISLGFELEPGQENVDHQRYLLKKKVYYKKTERYKRIVINAMKTKGEK